ncbi:hypothetical protein PGT21_000207 [Puccinia graminis f. sp. tritici]|uniref:CxC1-like cysteine cluster associated with KDZ transposases domain-containing protein n=1 Tax=Puccinia graminis f. sp. tritici TaxID=56615 RepID=A0A5B0NGW8_PUCGR|nr:hypothetical protein PGT21_000207 [Puccinia graminis f. sp. tritici]
MLGGESNRPWILGGGGKKPKRKRKPTTASGVAFSQAVELEQLSTRGEATTIHLDHHIPDRSGFDNFDQDHSNPYDHHFTDYTGNDTNFTNSDNTTHSDTQEKLLEEKNWAEVYDAMFSSFKQCAVKTADWGDEDKWRHDWKEPCLCQDKRFRPLVLVDIMSEEKPRLNSVAARETRSASYKWVTSEHPQSIPEPLSLSDSFTASESGPLYTVREWRKTLSASVDAYREMLRREKVVSEELMEMGPMDKLAEICPKCFGPPVTGKKPEEPDYIVCMDGNFQHRRHLAASHELSEF